MRKVLMMNTTVTSLFIVFTQKVAHKEDYKLFYYKAANFKDLTHWGSKCYFFDTPHYYDPLSRRYFMPFIIHQSCWEDAFLRNRLEQ